MTQEEILQKINDRISELETLRLQYKSTEMTLRTSLAQKEEETRILREQINAHLFESTEEYKELQELYVTRKRLPK